MTDDRTGGLREYVADLDAFIVAAGPKTLDPALMLRVLDAHHELSELVDLVEAAIERTNSAVLSALRRTPGLDSSARTVAPAA